MVDLVCQRRARREKRGRNETMHIQVGILAPAPKFHLQVSAPVISGFQDSPTPAISADNSPKVRHRIMGVGDFAPLLIHSLDEADALYRLAPFHEDG